MENLPLLPLIFLFIISGTITWLTGITLTKTTDTLDSRLKFGDAIGGLVLLGISGSLPEIAVCYSAARDGHIPVIIGNLLGGIAIQTLIIVIFDFAVRGKKPLSYLAGSAMLSIETIFAMILTAIALLAAFIPAEKSIYNLNPLSPIIVFVWIAGLFIINRARKIKKMNKTAEDSYPGRHHEERRKKENNPFYAKKSTLRVVLIFLSVCAATLFSGMVLEISGSAIAERMGISAGIFAATAIALVTSLPEISTGLESIFIGDNHLAISDIMGGNAFMLTLFLFSDIVAGKPVLSFAGHADIFLAALGIIMMAAYAISFMLKLKKRHFRLGFDSILEIVFYAVGIIILGFIK